MLSMLLGTPLERFEKAKVTGQASESESVCRSR